MTEDERIAQLQQVIKKAHDQISDRGRPGFNLALILILLREDGTGRCVLGGVLEGLEMLADKLASYADIDLVYLHALKGKAQLRRAARVRTQLTALSNARTLDEWVDQARFDIILVAGLIDESRTISPLTNDRVAVRELLDIVLEAKREAIEKQQKTEPTT